MPEHLAQFTRLARAELDTLDTLHNTLCNEIDTVRIVLGADRTHPVRRSLSEIALALDALNDLIRRHKRCATLRRGCIDDDRSDDFAASEYDRRVAAEMAADREGEEMAEALLTEDLPI